MKSKIIMAVAAALTAGVASLTLATGASAFSCTQVNGGSINTMNMSRPSGYSTGFCVLLTVRSRRQFVIQGSGHARFTQYVGLRATPANLRRCSRSVVILSFYKRNRNWRVVQHVKRNAIPRVNSSLRITSCSAVAVARLASGATAYRTIVKAIDGNGRNTGNRIAGLISSNI